MTVTFTSRDVENQVLERVRHLANRIVVFLKYCVFSCLAELLHCFRPVLEYCSPVFHHGLPKYLSDDIERVQKRALKIISPSMSYTDNLTGFNLQSLKARREDRCRRLFSTGLSDQTHKLRALLPPVNNSHYNLRTKRRFQRFVSKTNRFNNTFLPAMCNNF